MEDASRHMAQPTDMPPAGRTLAQRVAGSAFALAAKFGAGTVVTAVNTIAITRLMGPSEYGIYGAAVAASAVLGAVADFGFGLMLSRDAGEDSSRYRPMLRAAYSVASLWSLALAGVMVVLALTAPIGSQRGLSLLVLAPGMAFNGLNPAQTFFVVMFRTGTLARIGVAGAVAQTAASIGVAAAGAGPVAVCAVVSGGSIAVNVILSIVLNRMLPPSEGRFSRAELIKRSAPLGVLSIMTRVYLTIDLVLLGWYVAGPRLGDYAVASKLLTVLAGLAGTVVVGALPALASKAHSRGELDELSGSVWHWLMVSAVPMFLGIALFAPLIVDVGFGHQYERAVPLIRLLCIAGGITVISNLVGNLMVALHKMRALFFQNSGAIVLNVAGNVILIPHYGVYAAAWMTVATEALVCGASIFSLRNHISLGPLLGISVRPGVAAVLAAAVAVPLIGSQIVAACAAACVFVLSASILRAWPAELRLPGWLAAKVPGR
jgi:O-antigen/teichoic acid export membrane protein